MNDLVLHATFPPVPEAVEVARSYVGGAARLLGQEPDGPVLVASELVTNVVRHVARGSIALFVSAGPTAWFVEVVDELPDVVPDIPSPTAASSIDEQSESGRGLLIAASCADRLEAHVLGRTKSLSASFIRESSTSQPPASW